MMKKTLLALSAFVLLFAACKKDDNNPQTTYDNHSSPLMKMMHNMDSMMKGMSMTMDPDHDFAMMMKEHHMGAVDMAEYELANGKDAKIKGMAQIMKDDQMMEISQFDSFMTAHSPSSMNMAMMDSLDVSMVRMSTQSDAQTLNGKADHDFAHLMIVHHQSAVDMAKAAKMYAQTAFIKNMADMIISAQTQEIGELKAWLAAGND